MVKGGVAVGRGCPVTAHRNKLPLFSRLITASVKDTAGILSRLAGLSYSPVRGWSTPSSVKWLQISFKRFGDHIVCQP